VQQIVDILHDEAPNRACSCQSIRLPVGSLELQGELTIPVDARSLVIFAHGSTSTRRSAPDRWVARALAQRGCATLLFDALTHAERKLDATDERLRFDIRLLARRLVSVTDWISAQAFAKTLSIGYFGVGTGAAVALVAATERPGLVRSVVCRGGRPDLAGPAALARLLTPTLLLVGSEDPITVEANELAAQQMPSSTCLALVPDAGPLFDEPGTLETVAELAGDWFGAQSYPRLSAGATRQPPLKDEIQ
jgi:putative phosphoribosyl transferase